VTAFTSPVMRGDGAPSNRTARTAQRLQKPTRLTLAASCGTYKKLSRPLTGSRRRYEPGRQSSNVTPRTSSSPPFDVGAARALQYAPLPSLPPVGYGCITGAAAVDRTNSQALHEAANARSAQSRGRWRDRPLCQLASAAMTAKPAVISPTAE
jgi:hypothetical protein